MGSLGGYILVLVFGFGDTHWGDVKTRIGAIDSQQFSGFTSLDACNKAAAQIGPAMVEKYESVLGVKAIQVTYEHLCIEGPSGKKTAVVTHPGYLFRKP